MIRRKDLMKILFVGVCICHVCPAHPCGDNPMRFVNNFAHSKGIDSASMLHFMRLNTPTDYTVLMKEYRRYLECTQMVHNGYFKRSVDHVISHTDTQPSPFKEAILQNVRPLVLDDSLKLLKLNKDLKMNKNRINFMGYRLKLSKRDSFNSPVNVPLSESQYNPSSSNLSSFLKRQVEKWLTQNQKTERLSEPQLDVIETLKRKR